MGVLSSVTPRPCLGLLGRRIGGGTLPPGVASADLGGHGDLSVDNYTWSRCRGDQASLPDRMAKGFPGDC